MNSKLRKTISLIQILGGTWGLIIALFFILNGQYAMLIGFAFSVLSILAGVLLWRNTPIGKWTSITNLFLQIFGVRIGSVWFYYYSGFAFFIKFSTNYFGFKTRIGAGTVFGYSDKPISMVSINLFALIILIYLLSTRKSNTENVVEENTDGSING